MWKQHELWDGTYTLDDLLDAAEQHELWDGTYTLDDLLDAAELIQVRRENEERAAEAARS